MVSNHLVFGLWETAPACRFFEVGKVQVGENVLGNALETEKH